MSADYQQVNVAKQHQTLLEQHKEKIVKFYQLSNGAFNILRAESLEKTPGHISYRLRIKDSKGKQATVKIDQVYPSQGNSLEQWQAQNK